MERYNGYLITDAIIVVYLISKGINKFLDVDKAWSLGLNLFFDACLVILLLMILFGKGKFAVLSIRDSRIKKPLDIVMYILFIISIHKFGNVWDLVTYLALVFVFLIHIGFQIYLVAKKRISFRD